MSSVQPRGRREGSGQKIEEEEEGLDAYRDRAMNQMTYRPSGTSLERRLDVLRWPEIPSATRPRYLGPGQQMSLYPPPRNSSLGWEEERRLPPQPNSSPGWKEERQIPPQRNLSPGWQEERPLADSDTLPARWRYNQPAKRETRDTNHGQPTSKGTKVRFHTPAERRQRTPEDDDDEEESGSSRGNSLRGSMVNVEKGGHKRDDRNLEMSYVFDVSEYEGYGSGDEDGFVHVPLVDAVEREGLSDKV